LLRILIDHLGFSKLAQSVFKRQFSNFLKSCAS
jgi:hypothetical protein